jgi:hypothetical protein
MYVGRGKFPFLPKFKIVVISLIIHLKLLRKNPKNILEPELVGNIYSKDPTKVVGRF